MRAWIGVAVSGAGVAMAWAQPDAAFAAYQAQMAAAEKSLRLGEARELRRWLDATAPEMRGWEWGHLSRLADTCERKVDTPGTPIRVAMSPTGDRIAVVEGVEVRILSWPSLDESSVVRGHADAVYRAEFSPDGQRLVTVSRDVTSRTWDLPSGRELARISLSNPALAACTFDPSGARAATCAWERDKAGQVHGVVWIWDAASGEVLHRSQVGVKPLSSIRYTPDGSKLVVGSWDGLVHVLDAEGRELGRLELPEDGIYNAVNDVAVSADGRLAACASKDHSARVFSLESGELIVTLRGHGSDVEGVAFSPDGARLATCSSDATTSVWKCSDWSRQDVLRGSVDTVRGVAWAKDGVSLIGCSLEKRLLTWNTAASSRAAVDISTGHEGTYSSTISPDGSLVAAACYDGWMRLYDARSGALVREWHAHPGSTCHGAAFSADGARLVSCSWDRTARVWDVRDGSAIAVCVVGDGVSAIDISPNGAMVATSGSTVQVWRIDQTKRLHTISVDGTQPTQVAFSPDGALIASGWSDGLARVHRADDGSLVAELGAAGSVVAAVAFREDGRHIVTGDGSGVVCVFATSGPGALMTIDTGAAGVSALGWMNGRIAVGTDQLWIIDAEHGGVVLGMRPFADAVYHLDWSADGTRLGTCSIPGLIRILER